MNRKTNNLPFSFLTASLISANGGIIICLMHLVFHFIDMVNFAVGFLDNNFIKTIMLIVSVLSMFTAASVLIILKNRNKKSYFFRKTAFITFYLGIFNILIQCGVILPDVIERYHRNALWFAVSIFTLITSVFCNGLLVMNNTEKNEKAE